MNRLHSDGRESNSSSESRQKEKIQAQERGMETAGENI
jgi:hypothetical protein